MNQAKKKRLPPENKNLDPDVKPFVKNITHEWRKGVEAILQTAQLLLDAKKALPHGRFTAMVRDNLPFGPRMAQLLMNIGRHPLLTDAKYISHLPASVRTLDMLTQVDREQLQKALDDGTINPEETTYSFAKAMAGHVHTSVRQSVRVLLKFRRDWEDPEELARILFERVDARLLPDDVYQMRFLPEWLAALQKGLEAEEKASRERAEDNVHVTHDALEAAE